MEQGSLSPHVIVFPFPVQSHVNVMLNLAEILSISGLHITYLIPEHIQKGPHFDHISSRFAHYPGFCFETFSDGLPVSHPRTGDRVKELFDSINCTTKQQFGSILKRRALICNDRAPLTCIIADGIMSFTIDIVRDFDLPTILFRPFSATCFWTFFCVPKLIQAGELPLKAEHDIDRLVENIPGMEGVLRLRDLPSFCRVEDASDPQLQHVVSETHRAANAYGLILNTFEDLEQPALAHIRANIPKLYVVGPLHTYLRPSKSLSEEGRECIHWLDSQPLKSAVFVSFGNMTVLNRQQLLEFRHGLVNSGKPFLWAVPGNLIPGKSEVREELIKGCGERGKIVDWAPQEEILSHPATGGFLTHGGWNSTLESVYEGVPMICWPFYADQQVNSRLVEEVWRVGVDMKDICDRRIVEKMVRDLMEVRREELTRSAQELARLARKSVNEGGSSYTTLECLIQDIKLMNKPKSNKSKCIS